MGNAQTGDREEESRIQQNSDAVLPVALGAGGALIAFGTLAYMFSEEQHEKKEEEEDEKQYIYLSPKDVWYSQESCSSSFSNGKTLKETVTLLNDGELKWEDFPPMQVVYVEEEKEWRSLDNRRLYVFKKSIVQRHKIKCEIYPKGTKNKFKSRSTRDSHAIRIREEK